ADTSAMSREDEARLRGRAHSGQALLHQYAGNHQSADAEFAKAEATLSETLGESHPDTVATIGSRASNAYFASDTETARSEWLRSLAIAERLYDPLSPEVGTLKNNLGRLAL